MTRYPLLRAAWILALLGGTGLRAEAPPLFSPEPPEPAAAALVQTYLPLLAAGQFDQALALNDLRGMRQYLLDRRLSEFKAKNPELTEEDLAQMSAQIQVNDLNPARLEDILRQVMTEGGYTGMTWQVRGYAPAPAGIEGWLVSIGLTQWRFDAISQRARKTMISMKRMLSARATGPFRVKSVAVSRTAMRPIAPKTMTSAMSWLCDCRLAGRGRLPAIMVPMASCSCMESSISTMRKTSAQRNGTDQRSRIASQTSETMMMDHFT